MKKPRRRATLQDCNNKWPVYHVDSFLYNKAMSIYKDAKDYASLSSLIPAPSDSGFIKHLNKYLRVIDDLRCQNVASLKYPARKDSDDNGQDD